MESEKFFQYLGINLINPIYSLVKHPALPINPHKTG